MQQLLSTEPGRLHLSSHCPLGAKRPQRQLCPPQMPCNVASLAVGVVGKPGGKDLSGLCLSIPHPTARGFIQGHLGRAMVPGRHRHISSDTWMAQGLCVAVSCPSCTQSLCQAQASPGVKGRGSSHQCQPSSYWLCPVLPVMSQTLAGICSVLLCASVSPPTLWLRHI